MPDLVIRESASADPGKGERAENSEKEWSYALSYVVLHRLLFLRIQKCRHAGRAPQAEKHQAEVKRENEMRDREQHSGKAAAAQIGQDRFGSLW